MGLLREWAYSTAAHQSPPRLAGGRSAPVARGDGMSAKHLPRAKTISSRKYLSFFLAALAPRLGDSDLTVFWSGLSHLASTCNAWLRQLPHALLSRNLCPSCHRKIDLCEPNPPRRMPIQRSRLSTHADLVIAEWMISPATGCNQLALRIGVHRSTAWRAEKQLEGERRLVKSGRWYKLAEAVSAPSKPQSRAVSAHETLRPEGTL